MYSILAVLTTTMLVHLLMFSSTYNELVYAQQQEENQTNNTSKNGGNASYSFEAIINIEGNATKHLGATFFDTNATGNLEFLKSVVGVYKDVLDEKGTFAM